MPTRLSRNRTDATAGHLLGLHMISLPAATAFFATAKARQLELITKTVVLCSQIADGILRFAVVHLAWIFEANIPAVCIYTKTSSRQRLAKCLVLLDARLNLLEGELLDVAAISDLAPWHRCTQQAAPFRNDFLVAAPDAICAVHDGVPQGELKIADEPHDTLHLRLADEIAPHREESPVAHACCNSMPVKHACRKLIPRRPCVTEGVRAALVRLPEV